MPRIARKVYDNSYHHIFGRGNNKRNVFQDNQDFYKFLSLMQRYLERYPWQIYHYVLMDNHFHILAKIIKAEHLAKIMQGLNQSYCQYYKKKYDYFGHLWQGRFKNLLIQDDNYLLACGRYIEQNPLRAKMVADLAQYSWSSYHYYAYGKQSSLITPDLLYESFGKYTNKKRRAYREFVALANPYDKLLDQQWSRLV